MSGTPDSDEETPQLSGHALAALQEFYQEQKELEENRQSMIGGEKEAEMPEEDWQLSQFWYDEETATLLAKEAIATAGNDGRIICLSCPTMYEKLRKLKPESCTTVLLEYDPRFKMFGEEFVMYDYNSPLNLPSDFQNSFDIVVADPPFLSDECLMKTAQSMKYLTKKKILLCTGAVMEEQAKRLLNVKVCKFVPKHNRNLANEFRCYANYETVYLDR